VTTTYHIGTQTVRVRPRRLTPAETKARIKELEEENTVLQAQVDKARDQYDAFNAAVCALLQEKFHGRAFASTLAFASTQGWTVDVMPQKALGNIRFTCLDGNGEPQFKDEQAGPNDIKCAYEGCQSKAIFAERCDENGVAVNPRCGVHLPVGARIEQDKPLEVEVADEPEAPGCEGCGRKVGHNRDCKHYAEVAAVN
jgi:hypothetical protein